MIGFKLDDVGEKGEISMRYESFPWQSTVESGEETLSWAGTPPAGAIGGGIEMERAE
jgi:hypothetical protein